MTPLRARFAPLLPAVMLAASGCVYTVLPAPAPELKPAAASVPLSVGITAAEGANELTTALLRTGLFRDVRVASEGPAGFDLVVELTSKPDRTMHSFFPWFLPFCDPMILGCLPIYSVTEKFTIEMQAQLSVGKVYTETGEAQLKCQGAPGCAPASGGNGEAHSSAAQNGAAKLAADFLKDAAFYRDLARARRSAADARPAAEPSAAEPVSAAPPSAQPAGSQKPWWQN